MTYYKQTYSLDSRNYPNAEKIWKGTVSLPIYPDLTEEGLEYVCQTVKSLLDNRLNYFFFTEKISRRIPLYDNQLLNKASS